MKTSSFKTALSAALLLILIPNGGAWSEPSYGKTWANWQRHMEAAYEGVHVPSVPGRTMGVIVPASTRRDLLPLTAFGYEALSPFLRDTVVFIAQAPKNVPLNGIVMPDGESIGTTFGTFSINTELRNALGGQDYPVYVDNSPFGDKLPEIFETQLANIRYLNQGKIRKMQFLPMYVKFEDLNYQAKDFGPFIVEVIRELGIESEVSLVVLADLVDTRDWETRIIQNNALLTAIRNLDLDAMIEMVQQGQSDGAFTLPHMDSLGLGLLTFRWMGGDHAEILGYAHAGQLVLTKDKNQMTSYGAAAVASEPPFPPRIKHVDRDRMVKVFDEIFRADILEVARQAIASMLDPTAAKPASLIEKEASKKWPLYVTIYNPQGLVAGEAGTHNGQIPFEEALRQKAFEATQMAYGAGLTKGNANSYVVEIGIPYGFQNVDTPNDLIPILNGLIVETGGKSKGIHPNAWRTYPHPHQLLADICHSLGLKPWAYSTREAKIRSFRVLSFNEKEPFQDLAPKKEKKSKQQAEEDEDFGGGGIDSGAFPF